MNRGKSDKHAACRELTSQRRPGRVGQICAPFKRVLVRRIVIEGWRRMKPFDGPGDEISLGRMEIPARRVDSQRPARLAGLFPCRERQRILQELRHRGAAESCRRDVSRNERGLVPRLVSGRDEIKGYQRSAFETTEGIGLGRPIHGGRGSGKVAGVVLCPFVVGKHRSHRRRRRVHSRVNWCECHVPAQPTRQLDEIPEPCGLVLEMWRSSVTSSGARSYRDSCPCPSPTSYPCADGCRSWVGGHDQGRDRGRERPRGTRDRVGANALSSCGQRDVHPCRRRLWRGVSCRESAHPPPRRRQGSAHRAGKGCGAGSQVSQRSSRRECHPAPQHAGMGTTWLRRLECEEITPEYLTT